jgi:hypothetical protein
MKEWFSRAFLMKASPGKPRFAVIALWGLTCLAAAGQSSNLWLDLSTTNLASQGYDSHGTQPFAIDTVARRLLIGDASTQEHRHFYRSAPEIASGEVSVDVIVGIDAATVSTLGEDTGVHVALIEGNSDPINGREVRAVCVRRVGERRLALALSNGGISIGFPFAWD